MRWRQIEYREGHRQVLLGPHGKLGGLLGPQFDRLLEQPLGLGLVRCVEDRLDPLRDRLALVEAADIGLSVLLQMKLAALPRDGR